MNSENGNNQALSFQAMLFPNENHAKRGQMRIIDLTTNQLLEDVLIMLTPEEAARLWGAVEHIDATKANHIHVDDVEHKREITVAIYTKENLRFFRDEVRKVIEEP
jgi:hypothetical protein